MPATVVQLLTNAAARLHVPMETVLDVGCNVGGVALQLASHTTSVLAVDGSAEAIRVANSIKATGAVSVTLTVGHAYSSMQGVERVLYAAVSQNALQLLQVPPPDPPFLGGRQAGDRSSPALQRIG